MMEYGTGIMQSMFGCGIICANIYIPKYERNVQRDVGYIGITKLTQNENYGKKHCLIELSVDDC